MPEDEQKLSEWPCWIIHSWAPWKIEGEGKITTGGRQTGFWLRQKRLCLKCGKNEIDFQQRGLRE